MKAVLLLIALICGVVALPSPARACSCLVPDKARSYDNADHVVHVIIQRSFINTSSTRSYIARLVDDDYKGCLNRSQRVIIETPASSAACGMSLTVGKEYLLHGQKKGSLLGTPRLSVILCDANTEWSSLTPDHSAFLNTRYVCCGGECSCTDGSQPVNCFVDPCQVSSCDVDGAKCQANYCGGCNAEWRDPSGALVCENKATCDYSSPLKKYVSKDPEQCKLIDFLCVSGSPFFDDCGCGCSVPPAGDCKRSGCSGQLCVEPGDDRVTTCEWREEYACYQTASCERQPTGACGWTPTPELKACLEQAR
ncbi:MAG TPA: hypothetical protein VFQ61_15265 [Polyangiaceae bacterium]|nr:hypothetical protein [Polyangiaceae bacterium]